MNSIFKEAKYTGTVRIALAMLAAVTLLAGIAIPAQAQTESVLYSFLGPANGPPGSDGAYPTAGPMLKGTTLYGTTSQGGDYANGTVWAVSTTTGKETILYSFQGEPTDMWRPYGGLAYYQSSFYGTAWGGSVAGTDGGIFKLTKQGKEYVYTILFQFDGTDGAEPQFVTPVFDKEGNLYGTTAGGGSGNGGTVFKFAPASGTLTTLHNFNNNSCALGTDGCVPQCGVTLDSKGNLYGTTQLGGTYGWGTVYEITAAGAYSILYSFTGGDDGGYPYSPPVFKGSSLYGTTERGGSGEYGTVYKFTPAKGKKGAQMTILHNFSGYPDGATPWDGALVFDKEGNLYGTTEGGGTYTCGTIYELAPNGDETILHNFACSPDGDSPQGNVVFDTHGNLYTTTYADGAYTAGTVIKLTP